MVEVFTVGGGDYLVNVFQAVAAWTGNGGYKSLIAYDPADGRAVVLLNNADMAQDDMAAVATALFQSLDR